MKQKDDEFIKLTNQKNKLENDNQLIKTTQESTSQQDSAIFEDLKNQIITLKA